MRELFIYYRVDAPHAAQARAGVQAMQAALRERHPQLVMRLLQRTDTTDGPQTWMETYATDPARAPAGVDTALQAVIDDAARALAPLIAGTRHTEAFSACAS